MPKKTKRLSDKKLDALIEGVSGRFISLGGYLALMLLREVKERRAWDAALLRHTCTRRKR